jgi:hypothetical protein
MDPVRERSRVRIGERSKKFFSAFFCRIVVRACLSGYLASLSSQTWVFRSGNSL